MTLTDILLTIVIQTLFCLGLRALMTKNMLLHFMRKPWEDDKKAPWYTMPLVYCVICFSSVWGGAVFICFHGISLSLVPYLIITCTSTAFLIYTIIDYVEFE